ncbi:MAG: sigma 54-interacting transcriptional regulator [Sphaerochaeta sp.]|nr:sigma 54-interacting transcriptional regulator [Sphaerochaeta sp.]
MRQEPLNEHRIFETWLEFAQSKKDVDLTLLSAKVADSWRRSQQKGLDPFLVDLSSVSDQELNQRRRKVQELISSCLPYMHKLFTLLKNDQAVITLADADAVVLEVLANQVTYPEVSYPEEGTIHSEELVGTNAIGLTLKADAPIRVVGAEHWRKINHAWVCNAAPLHISNTLIGCINVACPIQGYDETVSIQPMVLATANAIERELMLKRTINDQEKIIQQQKTLLEFVDTGIIAIDRDGVIKQVNQQALDIFKMHGAWEGRLITDLIISDVNFMKLTEQGRMLEEQDLAVKIGSSYLHISCSTFKVELDKLGIRLVILVRTSATVRKIVNRASGASARYNFSDIIGSAPTMEQPLKIAHLASKNNANVLVMGETGTGKELLVQAIHNASDRKSKPFIAINCGAISRELIRSELFGYEGGAFTSAKSSGSLGKFELAEGGTLFLDEIGEMPLEVQSVLLRVLQTQEVVRIGGKYPIPVNVRVIAATHRDLAIAVQEQTFRNDLYYRLNVLSINLPPLRERAGDILQLTEFFLKKFREQFQKPNLHIDDAAIQQISCYSWPGNIRELENVLQRAAVICENDLITSADLPTSIIENQIAFSSSLPFGKDDHSIDDIKRDRLVHVLETTNGNLREVANLLHVSRGTVYNMLTRYQVDPDTFRKK